MDDQPDTSGWTQDLYDTLPPTNRSHGANPNPPVPLPIAQRPRRNFAPSLSKRYGKPTFEPSKLVKYSPKYGYSRIFNFPYYGSHWHPRMNSIVIQIHGIAAPNDHGPDSQVRAAGGVFLGKGARNQAFHLRLDLPQTHNRAVLEALRLALKEVITMRNTTLDPRWKEVLIMTNSSYVIESFSEWIWQWEVNGWQHIGRGDLIEHVATMSEIQHLLTHLESALNVAVRFWKVEREDLAGADQYAKLALRSIKI